VTWNLLAVKVGTLNTNGVCTISLQAAVHPLSGPHTTTTTITSPLSKVPNINRENEGNDVALAYCPSSKERPAVFRQPPPNTITSTTSVFCGSF
jgi:hypothetical protein